jgi:endonuclease I
VKKPFVLLLLFYLSCTLIFAQIPPGYYDSAEGLSGQALQAALHNIIRDHNSVDYSTLYFWFETTDKKSDNSVWDMYSDIPGGTPPYVYYYNMGEECGNYDSEGDCFNREHSWPNSWFGGEVYPMYSDLFMVYPTDGYVNNRRSNYPYGLVQTAGWTSQNGSKTGGCAWPGYSGTVFEPIEEYKGDFARTYFYVSTRYYTEDAGWPGSDMTIGSQLKPWALDMMLHWNSEDPVSQKETNRNNAVYPVQNNRNPFIDHPEFAYEIWGNPSAIRDENHPDFQLMICPNPASSTCSIELPHEINGNEITVILKTITGKSIQPGLSVQGQKITMDVRTLIPGIYLIILTSSPSHPVILSPVKLVVLPE